MLNLKKIGFDIDDENVMGDEHNFIDSISDDDMSLSTLVSKVKPVNEDVSSSFEISKEISNKYDSEDHSKPSRDCALNSSIDDEDEPVQAFVTCAFSRARGKKATSSSVPPVSLHGVSFHSKESKVF